MHNDKNNIICILYIIIMLLYCIFSVKDYYKTIWVMPYARCYRSCVCYIIIIIYNYICMSRESCLHKLRHISTVRCSCLFKKLK